MAETNKEYNKVVEYIQGLLKEGKLSTGDKLPTERAISETLSISRNSTREALRVLGNMGMVKSLQGSGNYLAGDITQNITDLLNMMLIIKSTNQLEISQLRRYMELAAFTIAFDHQNNFDTTALKDLLIKMEHSPIDEQSLFDKQFHYIILRASNNQLMISIMNAFSEVCETFVAKVLFSADADKKDSLFMAHKMIYQSITDRTEELGILAINRHYDIIDELISGQ